MSDIRQMPLFADQPTSPEELTRHTEMRYTIPLFQKYLLIEGKSQHTINAFTSDLQLLAEYTGEQTLIGKYTTAALNDFLDWLEYRRGIPCSRKSYARRVTTLKVYFKWLYANGAVPHDPAKMVLQRSGPAPLATILTPDEINQAITAARSMKRGTEVDTRPELLFCLLLNTGIKKSETMRLLPQDINRTKPNEPVLTVKHKSARNVYKERLLDIDPNLVNLLDAYLKQYAPQDTIFNCTARNLEYILTDVGEAAGIPNKLSFEMMRWTCAVRDYRSGFPEDFIREKLGLSRISWIETHTKIKKLLERQQAQEEANV